MPVIAERTVELRPELFESLSALSRQEGRPIKEVVNDLIGDSLLRLAREQEMERREQVMKELMAETEELGLYPWQQNHRGS